MKPPAPLMGSAIRVDTMFKLAFSMATDPSDLRGPYRNAQISLGPIEGGTFQPKLNFVTGTPDLAFAVARGEIDVSTMNPSGFLNMAYRGTGPFSEPLALRALAVLPTWDRMAFAVTERLGCSTLEELRDRRPAMRISLRGDLAHASRFVIDEVLGAYGFSLKDLEAWGGSFLYHVAPGEASRLEGVADGTVDAIFDEAVPTWGRVALGAGMRLLPLGQPGVDRMNALGWPVGPIPTSMVAGLKEEIPTAASFSGWPIYTRAELPDDTAYAIVRALHRVTPTLTWDKAETGTLADLCHDTDQAPLGIPLHAGAERYYQEQGVLA